MNQLGRNTSLEGQTAIIPALSAHDAGSKRASQQTLPAGRLDKILRMLITVIWVRGAAVRFRCRGIAGRSLSFSVLDISSMSVLFRMPQSCCGHECEALPVCAPTTHRWSCCWPAWCPSRWRWCSCPAGVYQAQQHAGMHADVENVQRALLRQHHAGETPMLLLLLQGLGQISHLAPVPVAWVRTSSET